MTETTRDDGPATWNRWRIAAWTTAGVFLLLPLIAMQFTEEIDWSVSDFAIMGALLAGVGVAFELAVRMSENAAYRFGAALALAAVFLLVWVNGAVGIIGSENDPANLMYAGVLGVAVLGALLARFRAAGMARALFATALAQALVTVVAIVAGFGLPYSGPAELLLLNGFFAGLWVSSALSFQRAARERASDGPGSR